MEALRSRLKDKGYIVIKNFLSPEEVDRLRDLCLSDKFQKQESVIKGDIISHKEFRDIFLNEKLINILKNFIGDDLYYICDGSARGDDKPLSSTARKFHSDSRADDFDFSKEYPLYRMGIYLQDMDKFSGGLKIRVGSHKKLCLDHGGLYEGFYRFIKYIKKYKKFPPINLSFGTNVECKAGDLLIWNMRLHHSGHAARIKFLPKLSLHPFIENLIPKSWLINALPKRCVLFFAFGKDSYYLKDYFFYISEHKDNIRHWNASDFSSVDLVSTVKELGVNLLYNKALADDADKQLYLNKKFF